MDPSDQKARDFIAQAEKASTAGVFSFFTGGVRWDEVAELYTKAANSYKLNKKWAQAAECFLKSAGANLNAGSKYNAANDYLNAANCYKKTSVPDAIATYKKAIEIFTDEGKFSQAAKQQKDLAELCEAEMDIEGAIENYQLSADFYEGENSPAAASGCLLKVAQFSAQLERYPRAIEIYEKIGFSSLDNKMLQWGAKDHFFRAALCHLANGDPVSTKKALERYVEKDPSFATSREFTFLNQIVTAFESFDQEAFTHAVSEYDSISRLDAWKTTICLRIKNQIKAEETPLV